MLRCLWLADLKHDYVCLQKALDECFVDYPDIIGEETYLYWKNANNDEFMKAERKADDFCGPKLYSNLNEAPKLIPENDQQQKLSANSEQIRLKAMNGKLDEFRARMEFGMTYPPSQSDLPNFNPAGYSPVYNPAGDAPDPMGINNYDDYRYI